VTGATRLGIVLLVAAVALATPAAAQEPMRSGLWAEFGRGGGNVHLGCSTCLEPTVRYGRSGYVRVGGSLTPRLLWGVEFFGLFDREFGSTEDGTTLTLDNAIASTVVLWYPWRGGIYFKGGLGLAHTELVAPVSEGTPEIITSGTGSGLTFGIGLDVPLSRRFSVTANFGMFYSAIGDVALLESVVDDVITTVYQANFAITIR